MRALSLRTRLVGVALVVGAAGLVGANVAVFGVVRTDLNQRLDGQLADLSTRRFFSRLIERGGGPGPDSGRAVAPPPGRTRSPLDVYTELRDGTGRRVGSPIRPPFSDEAPAAMKLSTSLGAPPTEPRIFQARDESGRRFRVVYRAVPEVADGRGDGGPNAGASGAFNGAKGFVIGLSTADRDATLRKLRTIQVTASALALGALALLSALLVRLGLRPLRRIEESAATIAAGDLAHRIDSRSPGTEVGRLSGSLNSMLAQIESAFAAKEESQAQLRRFVADASHELRTPLTSIRGYAELYRRGVARDGVELDRSMLRIESEATRMTRLVEDMLSLARLEGGRELLRVPVRIAPIVDGLVRDLRVVEPDRPVHLDALDDCTAIGDPDAITQLLTNLVSNARVHTPAGSPIEIGAELVAPADGGPAGAVVVVAVRDHGPGIAAQDQARLFQPFFRTDPARSRDRGGAGLGLAIAAEIAERLGGTIDVRSEVGAGATFIVSFPAAPDPHGVGSASSHRAPSEREASSASLPV